MLLFGCGGQAGEEQPLERPAARVGGTEIPLRELQAQYNAYEMSLKAAGAPLPKTEAEIGAALGSILEGMVEERMELYQAEKQGYADFDDAGEAAAEALFSDRKQQILAYYTAEAERLKQRAAELDTKAYAEAAIGQMAVDAGLNVKSLDEYWALLWARTKGDYAVSLMKEAAKGKLKPGEKEIRVVYDRILRENQARLEKGAGEYKSMEELYARCGGEPVLIAPQGYVRVYHVRTETPGAAREARDRLLQGEAFLDVAGSLSVDADYADCAIWREQGKPLSRFDSAIDWPAAVKTAVLALDTDGAVTDVVETDGGYYVCVLAGKQPAGTVSYEEAREALTALARDEAFHSYWEKLLHRWSRNIFIVRYYEQNTIFLIREYLM